MSLTLQDCTTFLMNVAVDEQWAREHLPPEYTLATLPGGQPTMDIWSSACAAASAGNGSLGPFQVSWAILPITNSQDALHLMGFAAVTTIDASPAVLDLARHISPSVQAGKITISSDTKVQVVVQGSQSSYTVSGSAQSPSTSRFLQNFTVLHTNGTMWIEGLARDDDNLLHPAAFEPLEGPTTDAPPAGAPMTTGTGRESHGDYEFAMAAGFIDDTNAS